MRDLSSGTGGDPFAQNHRGFGLESVKKNWGSLGWLAEGLSPAVLHVPRWVFHPIQDTKHENRAMQKQCKGVKETFHPYIKMWV